MSLRRMLFIDWNKKRSHGFRKYIREQLVDGVEEIHFVYPERGYVEGICFRNFPQLHITENQMLQCDFENCGDIFLTTDYGHANCRFENIKFLRCSGDFLTHCQFENMQCAGTALIELNKKCILTNCLFKNIDLMNEAWLVYGYDSSFTVRCEMHNVATDRKDGEFFCCERWRF